MKNKEKRESVQQNGGQAVKKAKKRAADPEKKQKVLGQIRYWTILNIGTFLLAVGVVFFKAPNNFATGGVSGLSILIASFIPKSVGRYLSQAVIMWIINVILLVIGFIFLGKGCTFKTAYCTVVYNLESVLLENICRWTGLKLPLTATAVMPEGQIFLEFVLAMLITGAASAILFNCKASSGGTDIIALIIKKYSKNIKNIGVALLVTDFLIAASSFFVFKDVKVGLYSILGLFAKAFLVDGVIESIAKSKYVTIITSKPDTIAPFILDTMHRSFTSYKATGGYTGEEKTVMLCVMNRGEALKLKAKIHAADPAAFVILNDTSEILGKNWQTLSD